MQNTGTQVRTTWSMAGSGRAPSRVIQWRWYRAALMMLDATIVVAASGVAYGIRMSGWLFGWTYENPIDVGGYALVVACSVPIWLTWSALLGLYTPDQLLGGMAEYQNVIKASSASVLTIIIATFLLRESTIDLSRWWLALAWSLSICGLTAARFIARRVVYRLWAAGVLVSRVLIVGANDQGVAIARQWRSSPRAGMHVVGFIDDFKAPGTVVCDDLSVVGRPSALESLVREYAADEVVVVSSAVAWETFGELVTAHHAERGYVMRLAPGLYDLLTSGMAVTNKTFVPLLTLQETRIVGIEAAVKAAFDITAAAAALALTAPAALLVVVLLRRRDAHAPLFVKTAVFGMRGRVFDQWRFRDGPEWLRRSGLDRWPQLWNVLRREMSIVGPRARACDQMQDASVASQLAAVRPGIVGPWVLHDATTSSDARRDEVTYVRNWEIWRDVPIVLHAVHRHWQRIGSRIAVRLHRAEASMHSDASQNASQNKEGG